MPAQPPHELCQRGCFHIHVTSFIELIQTSNLNQSFTSYHVEEGRKLHGPHVKSSPPPFLLILNFLNI